MSREVTDTGIVDRSAGQEKKMHYMDSIQV